MALDGERLRNIRTSKGISQEKLALMANVNKRTIQRAEKGAPIALETAAFIAEAVGVTAASLRSTQLEFFEPDKKAWNDVVLVPVNSGRRIIDALRASFESEVSFDVEPMKENIQPLAELASLLEPFKPTPWETPPEKYDPDQATVLKKQAEVNALIPTLLEMGINIFLGTYPANRKIPKYDYEEGCMYTKKSFPIESATVALVVVSDTITSHLMRKPDDVYDDDIPF